MQNNAQFDLFGGDSLPSASPPTDIKNCAPERQPKRPEPEAPASNKRCIKLDGQLIEFSLKRSQRRSIGLRIDDNGLHIAAPQRMTIAEIENAIRRKTNWIISKLQQRLQGSAHRLHKATEWRDGATLPYLGLPLTLRLRQSTEICIIHDEDNAALIVSLPATSTMAELRTATLKWLQSRALEVFSARMRHYATVLGVNYRQLGLSAARTRWGSCTPQGAIRLNWRLIYLPEALIDYVVAHELAHRHEMNHSARFWAKVESVYPDYRAARIELRKLGAEIPVEI